MAQDENAGKERHEMEPTRKDATSRGASRSKEKLLCRVLTVNLIPATETRTSLFATFVDGERDPVVRVRDVSPTFQALTLMHGWIDDTRPRLPTTTTWIRKETSQNC